MQSFQESAIWKMHKKQRWNEMQWVAVRKPPAIQPLNTNFTRFENHKKCLLLYRKNCTSFNLMSWKNTKMKFDALRLDRAYYVLALFRLIYMSGEQLVEENWIQILLAKDAWNGLNHISMRPMTECREIEMRKLYTFPLCKLRGDFKETIKISKKFHESN